MFSISKFIVVFLISPAFARVPNANQPNSALDSQKLRGKWDLVSDQFRNVSVTVSFKSENAANIAVGLLSDGQKYYLNLDARISGNTIITGAEDDYVLQKSPGDKDFLEMHICDVVDVDYKSFIAIICRPANYQIGSYPSAPTGFIWIRPEFELTSAKKNSIQKKIDESFNNAAY